MRHNKWDPPCYLIAVAMRAALDLDRHRVSDAVAHADYFKGDVPFVGLRITE